MPLILGLGSVGGGLISGIFGQQGSQQTADAMKYAANLQHQQYLQNAQTVQPFIGAGAGAAGSLASYLGVNGQGAQQGAMNAYQTGPFFQTALNTANRNTSNAYAAMGGAVGGNALNALYTQNAGLWNQQYNTFLQQLMGLSAQGVGAAGALTGAGTQAAATAGGLYGQAGQALGAGTAGFGNALGAGVNSAALYSLLGQNLPGQNLPDSYNTADYS
jgi:hypothetical protein